MLFFHPGAQYRFEIPDGWLLAAGALRFAPRLSCYVASADPQWPTRTVGVLQVDQLPGMAAPPSFDAERMTQVLRAMVTEQSLPPLWCSEQPGLGRLVLRHGLHRYHAAIALRFKQVPVSVRPHFEL